MMSAVVPRKATWGREGSLSDLSGILGRVGGSKRQEIARGLKRGKGLRAYV
jgi:hypothetical protein